MVFRLTRPRGKAFLLEAKHMAEQSVLIMDAQHMDRALTRIAHEIIERNPHLEDVVLVGIHRRGVPLAQTLADKIEQYEHVRVDMGMLDITF